MRITRAISLTNFAVASTALGFQVFVLYPWHVELDQGFEELKKEHRKVLDMAGSSLTALQRQKLADNLSDLEKRNTKKWWAWGS
jgi:hypothetical protein